MTKRTTYTKAFKLEAIRQLEESDKPRTQIANELGIRRNMLYKWQQQLSNKGEEAFQGSGRKVSKEDQLTTLERENTYEQNMKEM